MIPIYSPLVQSESVLIKIWVALYPIIWIIVFLILSAIGVLIATDISKNIFPGIVWYGKDEQKKKKTKEKSLWQRWNENNVTSWELQKHYL